MNDLISLVWLVVLLGFNAFFVAAEFAVIAARRSQIEPLAEQGSWSAKVALGAMENATLMLATSQLGITLCSLLILGVSEPALHHLVEGALAGTALPEDAVAGIAVGVAIGVVTYLHVVVGEMVPKNVAFSVPDRAVLILAPLLVGFAWIFRPFIVALNAVANGIVRLVGVEPRSEAQSVFTLEEMATIVEQSQKEGVFEDRSGAVSATIEFTAKKVSDVAVPLDSIVSLPEAASALDVEREVAQRGFSRYVLINPEGEPTGYVHLKDVIGIRENEADLPVPPKRIRQLVSVYSELDLEDALAAMRRTGAHIARVFDVAGDTVGVLFLEDIIEELIGEVQDATRRR